MIDHAGDPFQKFQAPVDTCGCPFAASGSKPDQIPWFDIVRVSRFSDQGGFYIQDRGHDRETWSSSIGQARETVALLKNRDLRMSDVKWMKIDDRRPLIKA